MEKEHKTRKIISAGIIIFRRTRDGLKFLLLYHGHGYWNFPKGKIESSERSWQTALREVREETGLKSSELKLLENFKTYEKFFFRRGKEHIFKIVILYLAETHQPQIMVSWEHEGYGWFSFGESKKFLSRYKENLKILETAHEFLRRRSVKGS